MSDGIEAVFLLIFILINLTEPVLGIPDFLSYLHYFAYTPATTPKQLVNQITGDSIALSQIILIDIMDALVSIPLTIIASIFLDLSSGGSTGGRTVHFSDGRVVTFKK